MDILITFLFIGGGFAEIPARLQPYEFCDDKAQEYITYVENPNYEEGNGQYLKPYNKDRALSTALPLIVHQADMMASRIEYETWKSGPVVAIKETRKVKRQKQVSTANESAKDLFNDFFKE